ncbi:TniB family NTP-binding protein, partial [Mesorhizobium sp. M1136]
MPSVAIYGDSGMGKSHDHEEVQGRTPAKLQSGDRHFDNTGSRHGDDQPARERRFYAELLTLLGVPQRRRADIAQMEQAALRIMEAIGVQVLVIDEVDNILAGSYHEQRIVLNTLSFLSDRLQISPVCFGVNEAREAISGDVQLARRFEQFTLSRWAANEQFENLVAASDYSALAFAKVSTAGARSFASFASVDREQLVASLHDGVPPRSDCARSSPRGRTVICDCSRRWSRDGKARRPNCA